MTEDYRKKDFHKNLFDFDEVWDFTLKHRVEILFQPDQQFHCIIDYNKIGDHGSWAIELTPLAALIIGIKNFKENNQ